MELSTAWLRLNLRQNDDIEAGHRMINTSNSRELENPRQTRKTTFRELRGQKWKV